MSQDPKQERCMHMSSHPVIDTRLPPSTLELNGSQVADLLGAAIRAKGYDIVGCFEIKLESPVKVQVQIANRPAQDGIAYRREGAGEPPVPPLLRGTT